MSILEKFIQIEQHFLLEEETSSTSEDILLMGSPSAVQEGRDYFYQELQKRLKKYFYSCEAQKVGMSLQGSNSLPSMKSIELLLSSFDVLRKYYGKNFFSNSEISLSLSPREIAFHISCSTESLSGKNIGKLFQNDFGQWSLKLVKGKYLASCTLNLESYIYKKNSLNHNQQGPLA